MNVDQSPIRRALITLASPSASHQPTTPPECIYTPTRHADALDPARTLVVGDRGVGKSFWAAVLFNNTPREIAANAYPQLGLQTLNVKLGFFEGAGGQDTIAPSPETIRQALGARYEPDLIWRGVLLKATGYNRVPSKFNELLKWIEEDSERYEAVVQQTDRRLAQNGKKLLLVFDALDMLATDWKTIQILTAGVLKQAQKIAAQTRNIRFKVFMRRDQFRALERHSFPDFSKLATAAAFLRWLPEDLYGAMFFTLWEKDAVARNVLQTLLPGAPLSVDYQNFPVMLKESALEQERLFVRIAGEFMGSSHKRGRTYTWVTNHLADAHGEVSLRSFFLTMQEAAKTARLTTNTAIDFRGIQAGVTKASETRGNELKEDYPWVETALQSLRGLKVPCDHGEILERWKKGKVVNTILARSNTTRPAIPIQLAEPVGPQEQALLEAMTDLGIIEIRKTGRVNVPDIFRVAADMKRKGGVPPRRNA